ncbi:MAG: PepSY domain-containing protein [Nitrospira sp.]|nr:PepSY domain-containing protein [Nitrospira sp.]
MNRAARQKQWLRVHWAIGLFAGALFAVMGLTGSALVFYQAIDEWLNPDRLIIEGDGTYRSFDDMAAAARAARPDLTGPYGLFLPQSRSGVVEAWFKAPAGDAEHVRDIEVTIDPYRAEVLSRDRIWGRTVVSFIYELHKAWLLDEVGETVVGGMGLLLVLSIGSGVYLWWPKPEKYRLAITFNPKGSRIRRQYDAHKLAGIAGSLVLLLLAGTGIYLEFPAYVVPLVKVVLPVPGETEWRSTAKPDVRPISVDQAVTIAMQRLPDGELKWIGLPLQADDVFQVGLRRPEEVRRTSSDSIVWLDQYSGIVLQVQDWRRFTAGETFLAWLFPLHNGEAFGLTGRWVVCFTGVIPLVLYVTALRMWWLKRQAHRRQRIKTETPVEPARPSFRLDTIESINRQSDLDR